MLMCLTCSVALESALAFPHMDQGKHSITHRMEVASALDNSNRGAKIILMMIHVDLGEMADPTKEIECQKALST